MPSIIEEIRELTANEVAKKQDAAKLNFPNIIEKCKKAAAHGKSQLVLSTNEMNQYDRMLLESEGFVIGLQDAPKDPCPRYSPCISQQPKYPELVKQWLIKW